MKIVSVAASDFWWKLWKKHKKVLHGNPNYVCESTYQESHFICTERTILDAFKVLIGVLKENNKCIIFERNNWTTWRNAIRVFLYKYNSWKKRGFFNLFRIGEITYNMDNGFLFMQCSGRDRYTLSIDVLVLKLDA